MAGQHIGKAKDDDYTRTYLELIRFLWKWISNPTWVAHVLLRSVYLQLFFYFFYFLFFFFWGGGGHAVFASAVSSKTSSIEVKPQLKTVYYVLGSIICDFKIEFFFPCFVMNRS